MESKEILSLYGNKKLQEWLRNNLEDGQRACVFGTQLTKYYNANKKVWIDVYHNTSVTQLSFIPSTQWVLVPSANQMELYISEFCSRNKLIWSYVLRGLDQHLIEIYDNNFDLVYATTTVDDSNLISTTCEISRIETVNWIVKSAVNANKFKSVVTAS